MRWAALWTYLMACAIAALGLAVAAVALGGNIWAWLLALPGMFVGLQVGGILVVLVCEAAERIGLLRRSWRPVADELIVVALLVLAAWPILPAPLMIGACGFFGAMILARLIFCMAWRPGEPVEVTA